MRRRTTMPSSASASTRNARSRRPTSKTWAAWELPCGDRQQLRHRGQRARAEPHRRDVPGCGGLLRREGRSRQRCLKDRNPPLSPESTGNARDRARAKDNEVPRLEERERQGTFIPLRQTCSLHLRVKVFRYGIDVRVTDCNLHFPRAKRLCESPQSRYR